MTYYNFCPKYKQVHGVVDTMSNYRHILFIQ